MLDKITNVSAGSGYNKAAKTANFSSVLSTAYSRRIDLHDSVDISPALQFLNQVSWRLKEFKHIANEKLFLDFIVSNIEFQTSIDLLNINAISSVNYFVLKEKIEERSRKKIITDISVRVGKINYDEVPALINFSALNIFFQRAFDSNVLRELTKDDKYILDGLLEGIFHGIRNEFDHLNNHLFVFFDKLTGNRIVNKERINNGYEEPVVIKKIKILNAE